MKTIRHLISIVFLFCGLTAWGGERGYDHSDMVGTYKYNENQEYVLDLHLHSDNTFMVANTVSDKTYKFFGKWEVKEDLVVLHFDEHEADTLQAHELDKYVIKVNEVWKDLIEQVVRDVVG